MLYEASRLLANQSYQHWVSYELFSFGWFFTITILVAFYVIWFKLVDTSKLTQLLLFGALSAVGFIIGELVAIQLFGVAEYQIRPIPFIPPLFIVSVTKAPIVFMLALQYTASWKSYSLWSGAGAGSAFLAFVIFPIYSLLGVLQLINWNYFYQFLYMFTDAMIARALLLLVIGIEQNSSVSNQASSMFSGLQPLATKPLDNEKKDAKKHNDK
jgi:hypothetical protein